MSKLHTIDVNLLVALDALTRERSVTRAAARTGITQSAMSHTLRRLRALFGDPLLVRVGTSMMLTPRAEALAVQLRVALVGLERALAEPDPFEPAASTREFRITSPDLFDVLVLPSLLRRLEREARGIAVLVANSFTRLSIGLETGDVDLAILPVLLGPGSFDLGPPMSQELRRRTMFRDRFRCFVRANNPALTSRRKLSAKKFTALSHVLVSPSGEGPGVVDRVLEEHGLKRRIALRVPQFATALAIVAQTDMALTAPSALGRYISGGDLVSLAPPIPLPQHAVTMVWHPRFSEDPGHRWFREVVAETARTAVAPE